MKNFLFMLMALIATIIPCNATVQGREFQHRTLPGAPNAGMTKIIDNPTTQKFSVKAKGGVQPSDDEEGCKVKCIFKYDPERYRPHFIDAYNDNILCENSYDDVNNYVYLSLKPGIYDFRAVYWRISETAYWGNEGWAYYIMEDIEVNEDMEIELDASLITECISFDTYNPNGEKSALRKIRYNGKHDYEIVSEGNVYDFYISNCIISKDNYFERFGNTGGVDIELGIFGEHKSEWDSNIYINPVSDKYQLMQLRVLYNENEIWVIPMFADGSKTQLVTNQNDPYSALTRVNFEKTPTGKNCDIISYEPYTIEWGLNNSWEQPYYMHGAKTSDNAFNNIRYCLSSSAASHSDYNVFMKFQAEDSAEIIDSYQECDNEGNVIYEWNNYSTIDLCSPYVCLGMDNLKILPRLDNRFLVKEEGGVISNWAFQLPISFDVNPKNMPLFGSSPKYMRFFYVVNDVSGWKYPLFGYDAFGYYGDNRTVNDGEIKIILNDKIKATSPEELRQWQIECRQSSMELGKLVFEYVNDNIEVDGYPGNTTARVCLDTSQPNFTMPLIQSVQFKNADNYVTDRFIDTTGARLVIAGGEFQEKRDEELTSDGEVPWWYNVEACDLKVEYAPYGSNDYAPIEMQVEGNVVHGFGYLYVGDLGVVNKESATGWFDLRILMTDAAGNTQEQIISPAFKIENLTGIQQVCVNKANLRIINGKVIADNNAEVEVFTLSGQRIENKDLPAGMYIARSGDSVTKLIVK